MELVTWVSADARHVGGIEHEARITAVSYRERQERQQRSPRAVSLNPCSLNLWKLRIVTSRLSRMVLTYGALNQEVRQG